MDLTTVDHSVRPLTCQFSEISMAITEIAPDVFQIVTYVPEADLQFNQFLMRDYDPEKNL